MLSVQGSKFHELLKNMMKLLEVDEQPQINNAVESLQTVYIYEKILTETATY